MYNLIRDNLLNKSYNWKDVLLLIIDLQFSNSNSVGVKTDWYMKPVGNRRTLKCTQSDQWERQLTLETHNMYHILIGQLNVNFSSSN